MTLMQLSAYCITLMSGILAFGFIKHHHHSIVRWFGVFAISIALFYLFSNEYNSLLIMKAGCSTIDRLLQRVCLGIVGISALSALQMATLLLPNKKPSFNIAAWVSLLCYYAAILIFDNKYVVSAMYFLPAALLLMLAFVQNYFTYLEKEISYGVIGSVLLFTNMSFEKLSTCLYPISCDCDFCCVILNGVAIALIAKAVHHIINKESKHKVRKYKKRAVCV